MQAVRGFLDGVRDNFVIQVQDGASRVMHSRMCCLLKTTGDEMLNGSFGYTDHEIVVIKILM